MIVVRRVLARVRGQARELWAYLAQPIVLRRRSLLAIAAGLGLLASGGIILGAWAIDDVADERSARSADARDALERELKRDVRLARGEAADAKRDADLARLKTPTVEDLLNRLRLIRQKAQRDPRLRRELQRIGLAMTPTPPTAAPAPSSTAPSGPTRSPSSTTGPPAPARTPTTSPPPPAPGGPPPAAAPPPSPSAPPSRPRPPVDVQTPPALPPVPPVQLPRPSVCLPGLGGLNCP